MDTSQPARKHLNLRVAFSEHDELAEAPAVGVGKSDPEEGGVALKTIHEAIARVQGEQQRLAAMQALTKATEEKLQAEQAASAEAEALVRAEQEQAALLRQSEQTALDARLALEARCVAEKQLAEQAREQARLEHRAVHAAVAKAREIAELTRIEGERAGAEEEELLALQQKNQAEEAQRLQAEQSAGTAKQVAELACQAAELTQQRLLAETEAKAAEEMRVEVERLAISNAEQKAAAETAAQAKAESMCVNLEQEKNQAQAFARQLMEKLSQERDEMEDWHFRAQILLAEAPVAVAAKPPTCLFKKVTSIFLGATAIAGLAGVAAWYLPARTGPNNAVANLFAVSATVLRPLVKGKHAAACSCARVCSGTQSASGIFAQSVLPA